MVTVEDVRQVLRAILDPELRINLVDLGLIYRIEVQEDGVVEVDMTLTALGCPEAPRIVTLVKNSIEALEGVKEARVNLVWSPPWTPERMSERARKALGLLR